MATTTFLWAAIVATAVWQLLAPLNRLARRDQAAPDSIESRRRNLLRRQSVVYALAGPLTRHLGALAARLAPRLSATLDVGMKRSGELTSLRADEWLAARLLESVALGLTSGLLAFSALRSALLPVCTALGVAALYTGLSCHLLRRRGQDRVRLIRARLPFVIDAVALMMEAGAGFRDAVAFAARNCGRHPINDELTRLLAAIERGRPSVEALHELGDRLHDGMVREFTSTAASSMCKGHAISGALLAMSVRMRLRRAHEIEAAAGRAQIQMYYPGFLLLLVCLAVMAAPFIAPMGKLLQTFNVTQG